MCWSGEASTVLAVVGFAGTAYAAYKKEPLALWLCLGYFTLMEALQAYTEFGAYSQSAETVKGRLVPGQWADIAVFDNDLLEAPLDTIKTGTRCVLTLLGGRVVHDAR